MLMGEHAVVYNRPCIVTTAGKRLYLEIEETEKKILAIEAPDIGMNNYEKQILETGKGEIPRGVLFIEKAIKNFHKASPIKTGLKIKTRSEMSNYGMGCSSAAAVCAIFGLSEITGLHLEKKEIFNLVYKTILEVQGKGSGYDAAAAIYGGTLYFLTGGKVIEPLNIGHLPIIAGYSGVKADTVNLIDQVKKKAEKYPQIIGGIYNQIERLVDLGKEAITRQDWESLGELMNVNHGLLTSLGVSTKKLEEMVYASREAGAYGAKLSGAGGGDCMIALHSVQGKLLVENAIRGIRAEVVQTDFSVDGVKVEQ